VSAEKKRFPDKIMQSGEIVEMEADDGVMNFVCNDNDHVIEFLAAFADFMTLTAEAIAVDPTVFRQTAIRLQATWENLPSQTINRVAEKVLFGTEVDLLGKAGFIWQRDV
jgi:hypothetical protein